MTASVCAELRRSLERSIVGQEHVIASLIVAVLCRGHILLEGPPGVAKTLACRTLAASLDADFKRVQFTPDLLPSDILGARIFDQRHLSFTTLLGPIFANVVLADEVNRAPAKVQAALLEAMQERQVTIGLQSYPLPDPFIVMATMNPLDTQGTYALPLAQCDRFLMCVEVGYPSAEQELQILQRFGASAPLSSGPVATLNELRIWQRQIDDVYVDARVRRYIVDLVGATRKSSAYIDYGASPRATLALDAVARARALLDERNFVLPDDVRDAAPDVLRHRIQFNERMAAEGARAGELIASLIAVVRVP
ncbi:MAG: MoxR family ATPase [Candidatus Eremiobacteraeota bacterium]|nr:MoxR family ATPase [Candidatus Eremiobacteraeota bacterium]